ncbi:MAG: intradiol ring-cleavage dioxygenase [bacterium]|nr:intradiol ring-cleavage dioxygenase [bacterium]
MIKKEKSRKEIVRKVLIVVLVFASFSASRLTGYPGQDTDKTQLPDCQWCGTTEAPEHLSWETRIAGPDEPGEPLSISGTIYKADGKTPAANVVMYLYHTNSKGIYPKKGDETGNGVRHGYLRSWLRTGKDGKYRFVTIKPKPYTNRRNPAHIHAVLMEPGKPEDWIDSYMFDDDPLITPTVRSRLKNKGGSGIVKLKKDQKNIWRGHRDIILK